MKTLRRAVLFLLVLLIGIGGIAVYWTFYRSLPDYNATIELSQLENEVDIHWDTFGVPHIYADSKHDLYYAMGYVHAQDRLWQMTFIQLVAEGRLAEFFGKELLEYDQLQRTIGFWRIAQQIEDQLSEDTRQSLQAYADGVNSYTQNHPKDLPVQFSLADIDPISWTPTHSIAMARLIAWELNFAWKTELTYAHLSETLSAEQMQQLLPQSEQWSPQQPQMEEDTTSVQIDSLFSLVKKSEELRALTGYAGSLVGSNAWAINASKTDHEYPLLAGDPHLGLSMPGKWYEVHYNLNGQNLSGATIPGSPAIIFGQNKVLGWSFTNVMLDDTDFFVESINPDNPDQYLVDSLAGEPLYDDFTSRREVIKIKNADDTTFTWRQTRHGPVISDVHPDRDTTDEQIIAMQWAGHEITNEIEAFLNLGWSTSFEEFREWASQIKVPATNIIYADTANNIARLTSAFVPVRDYNPVSLRRGWDPAYDWKGYIPYEDLPQEINPDKGWVANANNDITPDNYSNYMSVYWHHESRYERIRQYLSQNEILRTAAFQVMQNDSYSSYAQTMTEQILPVLQEEEERFSTAISYLENWDYTYEPSETAASIMDVFLLRLAENTFADEMGQEAFRQISRFPSILAESLERLVINNQTFADDTSTAANETVNDIIKQSMDEALSFLENTYGSEPFEWRWENLHTLHLEPEFFGEAADSPDAPTALKLIVDNLLTRGPYAPGGHHFSINNGEYSWNDPYEMVLGPSLRRIVDLSDLRRTLTIAPTGQSGNPLSEHYGDQTESWLNGQYKFFYQDSLFFDENPFRTMKLLPEK